MNKMLLRLKRHFCRHLFIGYDLEPRDSNKKCHWTCSKCGKLFSFDYGLQALDFGTITGPWGKKD